MRIAIICYQGANLLDISGINSVFAALPKENAKMLQLEHCSYLPMDFPSTGWGFYCTHIGLSLEEFDVLVLPGVQLNERQIFSEEFLRWLSSASSSAKWIALGESRHILTRIGYHPELLPPFPKIMAGYLSGLWIVNHQDNNIAWNLAVLMGVEKEWQQALRQTNGRSAKIYRKSAETQISVNLRLDGSGKANVATQIPFMDHMLSQIAKHGLFDIEMQAIGDLEVDSHHTVEDCALALGEAFSTALDDRIGIRRMGSASVPMDESLATVSLDFSGRPYAVIVSNWNGNQVAGLPVSLVEHFLESFATTSRCNLFIQVQAGNDNHHMAEAIFKALARALDQAVSLDVRREGQIPSTKEILF